MTRSERQCRRMAAEIEARGLHLQPVGTAGAVRIVGPGVYLLAASLHDLTLRDIDDAEKRDPDGNE